MHSIKKLSHALLTVSLLTQVHSMEPEKNKNWEITGTELLQNSQNQQILRIKLVNTLVNNIETQSHSLETEENKFSEKQLNTLVNNIETQDHSLGTEEWVYLENAFINIKCPDLTYRELEFAVNNPFKEGEKMAIVLNNEMWWINSQEAKIIDNFSLTKGHRRRFELNYGVGFCYENDKFELVEEHNSIIDQKYRCIYKITRGATAISFRLTRQYSDVEKFCKSVTACSGLSFTQHHAGWKIVPRIIQK